MYPVFILFALLCMLIQTDGQWDIWDIGAIWFWLCALLNWAFDTDSVLRR